MENRRHRKGWNIYLARGADQDEKIYDVNMTEKVARQRVKNLNLALSIETVLSGVFYFTHHGNHHHSERDAGLDGWIDDRE